MTDEVRLLSDKTPHEFTAWDIAGLIGIERKALIHISWKNRLFSFFMPRRFFHTYIDRIIVRYFRVGYEYRKLEEAKP